MAGPRPSSTGSSWQCRHHATDGVSLAVTAEDGRGGANSYYLRAPGRTDEATGCIHFLGDVPDGAASTSPPLIATRFWMRLVPPFSTPWALSQRLRGRRQAGPWLCVSPAPGASRFWVRGLKRRRASSTNSSPVCRRWVLRIWEIARLAKDGISHYHNETFTTLLFRRPSRECVMETDDVGRLQKEIRSLKSRWSGWRQAAQR